MTMDLERNKKKLFTSAMKGNWKEVVEIYGKDPMVQKEKITRTGDTGLHIAVSDGNVEVVAKMVDSVLTLSPKDRKEVLQTHNHRKNTALHLAASIGNAKMCRIIARAEPSLVDCRNVDGETPLFLAALYGRKRSFLWLHYIRNSDSISHPNYANCRRNYGDTILHCAIAGDYFDLAFQIIHLYKELVNWVNEEGLSPLHLLASKPTAFKSGCRLGRTETVIYHCIFAEELQVADPRRFQKYYPPHDEQPHPTAPKKDIKSEAHDYPDNYKTCWDVFRVVKTAVIGATKKLAVLFSKDKSAEDLELAAVGGSQVSGAQAHQLFPANYRTFSDMVKFLYLVLLIILGQGSDELKKIHRKKEKHTSSVQIMNELLRFTSLYEYDDNGSQPQLSTFPSDTVGVEGFSTFYKIKPSTLGQQDSEGGKHSKKRTKESPILIAAKNGVMEIIKKIVELFPVAIHDLNEDKRNIVLLAVEHRQPHVYEFLLQKNIFKESLFRQVDNMGNSALHLAATLGDYKPWLIPGEALQMQWEIKWYEFVKEPMPLDFFARHNRKYETPEDIFTKTHKELVKSGGEWLNKTSESCSVVAALIATVAFATAATVPGGLDQLSGHPVLEREPAFSVFAISSLIALCCSVTAVVMFLSILTSRFQEFDFGKDLPRKLILGLTSLFMSISSMLVSFCAGHFFVLKDQLHYIALPIYIVTCLPVTLFALAQFPLYFDLLWATFKHVPQRSYRATPVTSDHVWRMGHEEDAKPKDDEDKTGEKETKSTSAN